MKSKYQYTLMIIIFLLVLSWAASYIGLFQKPVQVSQIDSDTVHVHSDFLMYLNEERIDLTGENYQSTTYKPKHLSFHLHDGVDTMLHRHADDLTMADFLSSLGFILTDECITTNFGQVFCSNNNQQLQLYVNGVVHENPSTYITQEKDQILLYYGDPDQAIVAPLLDLVTDEACIYSGTCPERGDPPYESCAGRCEL